MSKNAPWYVDDGISYESRYVVASGNAETGVDWQLIAQVKTREHAHLIAAAQEMAALLEPMLDILGSYVAPTTSAEARQLALIDSIHAVQQKIRGETS